jgi:hypothetical protein
LKQPKYAPLQRYHVTGFSFAAFPSGVNRSPVDRNSKSVISKKRTAVKQICLSMVPHLEAFFVAFLAAAERGGGLPHRHCQSILLLSECFVAIRPMGWEKIYRCRLDSNCTPIFLSCAAMPAH